MESYNLLRKLGEGGNGAVFKGRFNTSGSLFAVKQIKGTGKETLAEREYQVGKSLDHPNLGKCFLFVKQGVLSW